MPFHILDPHVSLTMNVFLVIANIINLVYNLPQVWTTYKRKSTRDFSAWFLFLRIVGNLIWVAYAIEVASFLMLINNIVTVAASAFVAYYKVREMLADRRAKLAALASAEANAVEVELELDDNDDSDSLIIH